MAGGPSEGISFWVVEVRAALFPFVQTTAPSVKGLRLHFLKQEGRQVGWKGARGKEKRSSALLLGVESGVPLMAVRAAIPFSVYTAEIS